MKTIMALICVMICCSPHAQEYKRGLNWITGYSGNRVYFSSSINTISGLCANRYFTAGNSCISDTAGSLVLYSDGCNIYNKYCDTIEEGDTIIPHNFYIDEDGWSAYSQSSIFLPKDSHNFYFITPAMSDTQFADCLANNSCYFDLLLYNVVDVYANGGLGKVVKRMVPIVEHGRMRKTQMMACRHGNGKDWWLLKNEGDSANVHTFLFTQDSVYDKGVQAFADPVWGPWDIRGQSTFNSDGSMFATTSHGSSTGLIFVANFDRCYGILSSPRVIQLPWNSQHNPSDTTLMERLSVGLCFSSNNKFLYIASAWNIYQYDLTDSTLFQVAGLDTSFMQFQNYETMYAAPDGKIYIGNWGGLSKQMSRIDSPDVKGSGCGFCPRCLRLDSLGASIYSGNVGTPPCMPNYGLGAKTCWPLDTGNINAVSEWSVYPNPVFQNLIIKNAKGKKKILYDALGRVISTTCKDEIDVSGLSSGLYFLKIEGSCKKIIKE